MILFLVYIFDLFRTFSNILRSLIRVQFIGFGVPPGYSRLQACHIQEDENCQNCSEYRDYYFLFFLRSFFSLPELYDFPDNSRNFLNWNENVSCENNSRNYRPCSLSERVSKTFQYLCKLSIVSISVNTVGYNKIL